MKKTILLLTFLALACPAFAADKVITLQDGSKVKGDVISMTDGVYVVQTPSLGEIRIPESGIASISAATAMQEAALAQPQEHVQAPIPSNLSGTPEFKDMQTKMMANPEFMGDIQNLVQDPEVMAIMSDPGFITAVQSGNTAALQSDPRLKTLSDNPKIQALIQKMKAQQEQQ